MEAFKRGTIVIVKIYHKFYGSLVTSGVVDHIIGDGLVAVWVILPNLDCQNYFKQELWALPTTTIETTGYEFEASQVKSKW